MNLKLLLLVACFGIIPETLQSDSDLLVLTLGQKKKLDEFKELASSKDILPHAYMSEEIYLLRFLRAKHFNVRGAERMLMDNIRYREQNKIDGILSENWTNFNRIYPYSIDTCDKQGIPVVTVHVGDWPVRKGVIAGQTRKIMRYFDKYLEEITTFVRRNGNVTQYSQIIDLSNYSLNQGCPGCIPIYVHWFQVYESNYPLMLHKTYLINTPTIFQSLYQILKQFLSERTRNSVQVFGRNPKDWAEMFKEIDRNQLSADFGGWKETSNIDIQEIRKQINGTFKCPSK